MAAVFSLLFALAWVLGAHVVYDGGIKGYPTENYMTMPGASDYLRFGLAGLVCFLVLLILYALISRLECREGKSNKRLFIFTLVFLLLAWTPYLLSFYPGSIQGDSFSSIRQIIEVGRPDNNHHPVFYTLFLGIFLKIGLLLNDLNIGVFIYSLCQCLLMALTLCRVVCFLQRKGVHRLVLGAVILFYAFEPLFPVYAISLWKDPLYSAAMLLFSIELYECASCGELRGSGLFRLISLSLLMCFLRNNGVYVLIVAAAALTLKLKGWRIKTAIIFAVTICVYFVLTTIGYRAWGIKQEFVESVGIPVQQMGAVIYYEGEMSPEDEDYIYELMPQWAWQEYYAPCLVDQIKWNYFFNEEFLEQTKPEFIKTWFSMLKKNPVIYVRAYIMETHGFWKWGVQDDYGYTQLIPDSVNEADMYGLHMRDLFKPVFGFSITEPLKSIKGAIGSGSLFWLCGAALLLCLMKRRGGAWLMYIPALANWACIMIATPAAYGMRYVYIFPLALPLLLLAPFFAERNEQ